MSKGTPHTSVSLSVGLCDFVRVQAKRRHITAQSILSYAIMLAAVEPPPYRAYANTLRRSRSATSSAGIYPLLLTDRRVRRALDNLVPAYFGTVSHAVEWALANVGTEAADVAQGNGVFLHLRRALEEEVDALPGSAYT